MKSDSEQPEYDPKSSKDTLLTYQFTNRYLTKLGLGSYADDIYQDIFCRLKRAIREGKKVDKHYAYSILRNLATDKYRELGRQRKHAQELNDRATTQAENNQIDCPYENVARNELKEIVASIIPRLNKRRKIIVTLYALSNEKFTFSDIGKIIGCSESTVRVDYHHAVKDIQKQLIQK